jgi:hypothetical protein
VTYISARFQARLIIHSSVSVGIRLALLLNRGTALSDAVSRSLISTQPGQWPRQGTIVPYLPLFGYSG